MDQIKKFAGNKCKTSDFCLKLSQVTSRDVFVVTSVSIIRKYIEHKPTEEIEGVRYSVIDTHTFTPFSIKTTETIPVVTQEELEKNENTVKIRVPIDECIIKPYRIEYGNVFVSIVVPSVEIADEELFETDF